MTNPLTLSGYVKYAIVVCINVKNQARGNRRINMCNCTPLWIHITMLVLGIVIVSSLFIWAHGVIKGWWK